MVSVGNALDAIYETGITESFYSGGPTDPETVWTRDSLCASNHGAADGDDPVLVDVFPCEDED